MMDEEMLRVLCASQNAQPVVQSLCVSSHFAPKVTTQEQYQFLDKNINYLSYETKYEIARLLVVAGESDKIEDCNQGVAISMDIDDELIEKMYNLAYYETHHVS